MQIITPFQNSILQRFSSLPDARQFYFTGGTALSLFYLKHRRSEDLDFFTSDADVIAPFSQLLVKDLQTGGYHTAILRGYQSFTELKISNQKEETIIHLALDAAFHLEPYQQFADFPHLNVEGLTDMAANKLLALFGRAALRDFIDVYYLIHSGRFSKEQLIGLARQKDPGFDLYWLGVAFEQIKAYQQKDYDLSLVFVSLKEQNLLSFFQQWRREIGSALSAE